MRYVLEERVISQITKHKRDYWEIFTKDMEHDMYGTQMKVWGMLMRAKQEIKEYTESQT